MSLGLEQRASLGWIGFLRAIAGGILLSAGVGKLSMKFDAPALIAQLADWRLSGHSFGWAASLAEQHVLPRAELFTNLVIIGELGVGLLLLLGLASRLAAFTALLMHLSYFLVSREDINLLLVGIHLAVLVTAGGRALGLDLVVKRKLSWWFLG